MTIVYPSCPRCGEELAARPLYTAASPYRYPVIHDHAGCSVVKYEVVVHPSGQVEPARIVPGHLRFEQVTARAS